MAGGAPATHVSSPALERRIYLGSLRAPMRRIEWARVSFALAITSLSCIHPSSRCTAKVLASCRTPSIALSTWLKRPATLSISALVVRTRCGGVLSNHDRAHIAAPCDNLDFPYSCSTSIAVDGDSMSQFAMEEWRELRVFLRAGNTTWSMCLAHFKSSECTIPRYLYSAARKIEWGLLVVAGAPSIWRSSHPQSHAFGGVFGL